MLISYSVTLSSPFQIKLIFLLLITLSHQLFFLFLFIILQRSLAGVVRDIKSIDLLSHVTNDTGLTLPIYQKLIKHAAHSRCAYRHYCSAVIPFIISLPSQDYFIFSKSTPLSVFGPYVLGRYSIDNYLLSRMQYCNGTLVDVTFSGIY